MTLAELFPDADYRFPLNVGKGSARDYFAPTAANAEVLAERRHWLASAPETYALLRPEGEPLVIEMAEVMHAWGRIADRKSENSGTPLERCLALGQALEPDFVLLPRGEDGNFRVAAGALCFPSHWSLPEKAGLPVESIHGIVPGLNAAIGPAIAKILQKLRPDAPLFRSNWGLQLGRERNDHPARTLPRLAADSPLDEVWLRVEHQALIVLPRTGGLLFGIRIAHHPLAEITAEPTLARNLLRALQTMSEPMQRYKGLSAILSKLLSLLPSPPIGSVGSLG